MSKFLILLIVLTTLINLSECKVDRCRQPKLEGNNCGGTRWWYVAKEKVCKSFKGCGGNDFPHISPTKDVGEIRTILILSLVARKLAKVIN
uniref:BPTI/Kunitz inhibitor domain-containing protein n=1 Tax=Meloidogyne incognita TaxID=6306 RepID=A0A914NET3_MELIC